MSQTCRLDPCAVTTFFFERFGQRMYATASGLLSKQDRSLSPDVTHDTFLTFHCAVDANQLACLHNCRTSGLNRQIRPCWCYLISVLRRRCHDIFVERERASEVSLERIDRSCLCDRLPGPQQTAAQKELCHAVYTGLDRLTLPYREVIVLRAIAGLGFEEISRQLEIPQTTVRTRLTQARKQLRFELEGVMYDM